VWLFLLILSIALGLWPASNLTPQGYYETRLGALTGPQSFSLTLWTVRAFGDKLHQAIDKPGAGLPPAERQKVFDEFFDAAGEINRLEAEISDLANRGVVNSDPHLADLERQLRDLRQKRAQQAALVERVIEDQVQTILRQENLAILQKDGVFFPPVISKIIDLPHMLVVSPRASIEMKSGVAIRRSISTQEMNDLEATVDRDLNVRSLLVAIGGLGTYPTMIAGNYGRDFAIGVTAHEWCHVYLTFHPLGFNYGKSGQVTAINETVCSIFEGDVSAAVRETFYGAEKTARPWQATPTPTPAPGEQPKPEEPQGFNERRELRKIFLAAEERLKANDVAGAEQIMEDGRRFLAENNVFLRKLNQAFYAFYGNYAEGPESFRSDTIGDDLRELRRRSATLRDFMLSVETMTSYDDLKRALGKE
jgi:hypothetical protein